MGSLYERGNEAARHERAITSLSTRTGASLAGVRALFTRELARLELRAKVRTYLSVLTTSNVRAMLTGKGGESLRKSMATPILSTLAASVRRLLVEPAAAERLLLSPAAPPSQSAAQLMAGTVTAPGTVPLDSSVSR